MYARPLVSDGDFFEEMEKSTKAVIQLFQSIPVNKYHHRYAADKWAILEVLQHLIDVERIFSYRALCFRLIGHDWNLIRITREQSST